MTNFLKLINREEQNEFANSATCNNGGGYFQPLLEYEGLFAGKRISVCIDDTSCGAFGERYDVYVNFNGTEAGYSFDNISRNDIEHGNIPKDIADFIKKETGYYCFH